MRHSGHRSGTAAAFADNKKHKVAGKRAATL